MRALDTAILTALAGIGFDVLDGAVPTDSSGQVVARALPYAVFYSSVGDERSSRLSGRTGASAMGFRLTYVGRDRNQAKWAGELLRDELTSRRLTVSGQRTWLITLDESQAVLRDDDVRFSDGTRLFYGTDLYTVAATKTPAQPELT